MNNNGDVFGASPRTQETTNEKHLEGTVDTIESDPDRVNHQIPLRGREMGDGSGRLASWP